MTSFSDFEKLVMLSPLQGDKQLDISAFAFAFVFRTQSFSTDVHTGTFQEILYMRHHEIIADANIYPICILQAYDVKWDTSTKFDN